MSMCVYCVLVCVCFEIPPMPILSLLLFLPVDSSSNLPPFLFSFLYLATLNLNLSYACL